jgi:hypothetical protein
MQDSCEFGQTDRRAFKPDHRRGATGSVSQARQNKFQGETHGGSSIVSIAARASSPGRRANVRRSHLAQTADDQRPHRLDIVDNKK